MRAGAFCIKKPSNRNLIRRLKDRPHYAVPALAAASHSFGDLAGYPDR